MFIERWIFDMNSINKNTKKGFTIIEVVLVLAIAGLIFLMVFLALPALQRSQCDTQRENDASRLRAAVTDYQSNNRGAVPFDGGNLKNNLIQNFVTVRSSSTFAVRLDGNIEGNGQSIVVSVKTENGVANCVEG